MFKKEELIKGLVIGGLGAFGVYWTFNMPCGIVANPTIGLTEEMAKLMCLAANPMTMIISIVATSALFVGASKVFNNI